MLKILLLLAFLVIFQSINLAKASECDDNECAYFFPMAENRSGVHYFRTTETHLHQQELWESMNGIGFDDDVEEKYRQRSVLSTQLNNTNHLIAIGYGLHTKTYSYTSVDGNQWKSLRFPYENDQVNFASLFEANGQIFSVLGADCAENDWDGPHHYWTVEYYRRAQHYDNIQRCDTLAFFQLQAVNGSATHEWVLLYELSGLGATSSDVQVMDADGTDRVFLAVQTLNMVKVLSSSNPVENNWNVNNLNVNSGHFPMGLSFAQTDNLALYLSLRQDSHLIQSGISIQFHSDDLGETWASTELNITDNNGVRGDMFSLTTLFGQHYGVATELWSGTQTVRDRDDYDRSLLKGEQCVSAPSCDIGLSNGSGDISVISSTDLGDGTFEVCRLQSHCGQIFTQVHAQSVPDMSNFVSFYPATGMITSLDISLGLSKHRPVMFKPSGVGCSLAGCDLPTSPESSRHLMILLPDVNDGNKLKIHRLMKNIDNVDTSSDTQYVLTHYWETITLPFGESYMDESGKVSPANIVQYHTGIAVMWQDATDGQYYIRTTRDLHELNKLDSWTEPVQVIEAEGLYSQTKIVFAPYSVPTLHQVNMVPASSFIEVQHFSSVGIGDGKFALYEGQHDIFSASKQRASDYISTVSYQDGTYLAMPRDPNYMELCHIEQQLCQFLSFNPHDGPSLGVNDTQDHMYMAFRVKSEEGLPTQIKLKVSDEPMNRSAWGKLTNTPYLTAYGPRIVFDNDNVWLVFSDSSNGDALSLDIFDIETNSWMFSENGGIDVMSALDYIATGTSPSFIFYHNHE